MQFAVPQFTDVEDKLIGPLTLKQFLMLLGFSGILFFFWSILGTGILFFLIAIPFGIGAAFVTFKKYNGRPFFIYLFPLLSYLLSPKVLIFKREPAVITFTAKEIKKPAKAESLLNGVEPEPTESRLKNLAYLLDQKVREESDLISHVPLAEPAVEYAPPRTAMPNPAAQIIGDNRVEASEPEPADSGESELTRAIRKISHAKSVMRRHTATKTRHEPSAPRPLPPAPSASPAPRPKQFNPDDILKINIE